MRRPRFQPTLLVSARDRQIQADDGYVYPLNTRFLYLYYYLALARRRDRRREGGFVDIDEIHRLPGWQRNQIASIGKQIRRHIQSLEADNRNIIEARQKIKGPFRLTVEPDQIRLDSPVAVFADLLQIQIPWEARGVADDRFFRFVEYLCRGNTYFEAGQLAQALSAYQKAAASAQTFEQRVVALHKLGRGLERQGQYNRAIALYRSVLSSQAKQRLTDHDAARTYALLGWTCYRKGESHLAERYYDKARELIRERPHFQTLGDVFNGLGEIRKHQGAFPDAIEYYDRALHYWILADYLYGVQAVYFNLAHTYERWGSHLERAPNGVRLAQTYYRTAIRWALQCKRLCETAGIAYETSQDHILLAILFHKVGNMSRAMEFAQRAKEMAEAAGNTRDIAMSDRVLGRIYRAQGDHTAATAALSHSIELLKKLGDVRTAERLVRELRQETA